MAARYIAPGEEIIDVYQFDGRSTKRDVLDFIDSGEQYHELSCNTESRIFSEARLYPSRSAGRAS